MSTVDIHLNGAPHQTTPVTWVRQTSPGVADLHGYPIASVTLALPDEIWSNEELIYGLTKLMLQVSHQSAEAARQRSSDYIQLPLPLT